MSDCLEGRTVWMLNSTAHGGGVAEMLPRMVTLLNELGVKTRWVVMATEKKEFFPLTKRIHNLIHGSGDPRFSDADQQLYDRVSQEVAEELGKMVAPGDVLVVHDPQPAGVGAILREKFDILAVWRCHIGLDETTAETKAAWRFLKPYVESYDHCVFTAPEYIPGYLGPRVSVIHPALDPFTHKNREIGRAHV